MSFYFCETIQTLSGANACDSGGSEFECMYLYVETSVKKFSQILTSSILTVDL